MIFGRKNRRQAEDIEPVVEDAAESDAQDLAEGASDDQPRHVAPDEEVEVAAPQPASREDAPAELTESDEIEADEDAAQELDEVDDADAGDIREDGPFDASEVDLDGDDVDRLDLGPMTITPFDGMGLQFQGNPETQEIYSVLVMHENSGLQIELFAAPTSSGLADELREDMLDETQQAGGNAELGSGPFGREIKRVLPMEGSEGEQLFHVSRIWLVDGPRWLLRGTLMGQAALVEGEEEPSDLFIEFFRNIVVHRDDTPRVPGALLTLTLPELPGAQG